MTEDNIEHLERLRNLVTECFLTHNQEVLVKMIYKLQQEYVEIAKLATLNEYKTTWTHKEVLDHITFFS